MAHDPAVARHVLAGAPLERAAPAAVLVHGRGQDASVMLDLLVRVDRPHVGSLLPEALAGTWYAGRFNEPVARLEPELSAALAEVEAAVQLAAASAREVVLIGFSQGACLVAEHLARRGRERIAAAAILTGALIGGGDALARTLAPLDGLPVACVSSEHDEWVPIADVRASAAALRAAGAQVELTVTGTHAHEIDAAAVTAVRALLDAAA